MPVCVCVRAYRMPSFSIKEKILLVLLYLSLLFFGDRKCARAAINFCINCGSTLEYVCVCIECACMCVCVCFMALAGCGLQLQLKSV